MNKLDYKRTLLLGFGFFAVSITWSVYNSFMPKILSNYITSAAVIGFIMTIDNYLALFIQPAIGSLSDRTNTRFGKRMPFIMIGMPLAVMFLLLLPNYKGFISLLAFLVLMNLSMSIFRSPVISLMPDITHSENRSKANGIINLMGGLGAVIAYLVGSILWDKNEAYPFYLAAFLVGLSFIVLFSFIKEKRDVIGYEIKETQGKKESFIKRLKETNNTGNIAFLLLAICSWFIAFQGIEAFFTLYGVNYLGLKASAASISFTFISISFLVFSIPAGLIGTRFGKKKAILIGICGLVISFSIIAFLKTIWPIRIVFLICGFFWAMININSYPFVIDMAGKGETGTYTGLYYFSSSIAAIVSPPLLGGLIDLVGYRYTFWYGTVFFTMAFMFLSRVKNHGNEMSI